MDGETKFCLVKFEGCGPDGKHLVDLVPKIWIFDFQNRVKCFYPPENEHSMIDEYVKNMKMPEDTWPSFYVGVILLAVDYKQGKRCLEESYGKIGEMASFVKKEPNESGPEPPCEVMLTLDEEETEQILESTSYSHEDPSADHTIINWENGDVTYVSLPVNSGCYEEGNCTKSSQKRKHDDSTPNAFGSSPAKQQTTERSVSSEEGVGESEIINLNQLWERIKTYIDMKFNNLEEKMQNVVTTTDESGQFTDILQVCATSTNLAMKLLPLPLSTVEDFKSFDFELNNEKTKNNLPCFSNAAEIYVLLYHKWNIKLQRSTQEYHVQNHEEECARKIFCERQIVMWSTKREFLKY